MPLPHSTLGDLMARADIMNCTTRQGIYGPLAMACRTGGRRTRAAFTLTELLVVLIIVALLSTMLLSGLLSARESQRAAKTAATVRKLSEIILPYYEQYEDRRPSLPSISGLSRNSVEELRRIAIRRLMTLELPERELDVPDAPGSIAQAMSYGRHVVPAAAISAPSSMGPFVLAEVPPAARRYADVIAQAVSGGAKVNSSELLYLIISRGPVADPDVVAHFRDDEVRDLDGDGLLEFVDGWNRPVGFLRWPVCFASPVQPIDGTRVGIDTLISTRGHRLVPLIYSAGSDGSYDVFGLPGGGADPAFAYAAPNCHYDPFHYVTGGGRPEDGVMNCLPAQALAQSVVLQPSSAAGDLTFIAQRLGNTGSLPQGAFQGIGSERDLDGDGVIGSLDNIHNHDLSR
jgi:prepilin-type N-terminal cleavage/methylation domain-containing protein